MGGEGKGGGREGEVKGGVPLLRLPVPLQLPAAGDAAAHGLGIELTFAIAQLSLRTSSALHFRKNN